MKIVTVVGTGTGAKTLTAEALEAIARSEVLLGAPRMLELYAGTQRSFPEYLPDAVAARVASEDAERFAVLVSGDVGFYSAAAKLAGALTDCEVRFIPGISVVNAFFAKHGLPWQDAAFVSAHGRDADVTSAVRRNRFTFCLTGGNADKLGARLDGCGFGDLTVHVGENLGSDSERIYATTASELANSAFPPLTVLLFVNDEFDDAAPCGLPDDAFTRLVGVPMTKSEVRAVVISKLRLRPGFTCWDVGAGTGSVTVEMALNAYRGHVYAIERREDAVPLIRQNCASHHAGNVTAVHGKAPDALDALPPPDAVFIGGSGGELGAIIHAALSKNANARIVVTAVTLETAASALAVFGNAGTEPEIVQLNVSRAKKAGASHLMEAQNPVTVISAGGAP